MHPDSWRYRGCLIFLSLPYFTRVFIFRVAVLVSADIYPGMILYGSLPYGMVDITIVGCLARPCHLAHD